MENKSSNNAIIDKLKENVIAKLDELDASKKHDSTLIDYILVMVVNQKSKFEMKHNLSLFLGKIVDDFVNWLFDFLGELKMKSTEESKMAVPKEKVSKSAETLEIVETKHERRSADNEKVEMKSEKSPKKVSKRKLKSAIIATTNEDSVKTRESANSEKTESNSKSKKRSLANDDETYSSKKRSVFDSSERDSKKTSNSEGIDSKMSIPVDVDDASKENETKFLVTLDGVKDMFKDNDGLFLLDDDFDPELMAEDLSNLPNTNKNSPDKNDVSIKENNNSNNKGAERCKYWPSCMNGPSCEFFHPVTKCNTFPYCRFGEKCLYIHPTCKFDSFCSRSDCPFVHTAVKARVQATPAVTCKYFPNCMKPACEFFHPKICHFGAACKAFNCPFVHLPVPNPMQAPKASNVSKFKWSSSKKDGSEMSMNKKEIEIK